MKIGLVWWVRLRPGWLGALLLAQFVALLAGAAAVADVAAAAATSAPLLEGRVSRVTDGDSLWLEPAPPLAPVQLRLEGIDAPEICQAWGPEARAALSEWVLGRTVRVKTVGHDTHGRTLGTVYLDEHNINKRMVEEGHAWSSRFKYDRGPYVAAERMARALSRGLNRDGAAIMPREFRQQHGPCHGAATAASNAAASAATPAPASPATAPAPPTLPLALTPRAEPRCDGRTRCAQMTSCEEAHWFLRHCPGVQMDGDRDGVPCERQWCGS